jgi:hypothetical protein
LPGQTDATWFLHDLGVVVLHDAVDLGPYPVLPSVDQLDELGKGRNRAIVTFLGYAFSWS